MGKKKKKEQKAKLLVTMMRVCKDCSVSVDMIPWLDLTPLHSVCEQTHLSFCGLLAKEKSRPPAKLEQFQPNLSQEIKFWANGHKPPFLCPRKAGKTRFVRGGMWLIYRTIFSNIHHTHGYYHNDAGHANACWAFLAAAFFSFSARGSMSFIESISPFLFNFILRRPIFLCQ